MTLTLLLHNAALVLGLMTVLWIVSVSRRNASIVDPWWSMAFLLVTGHTVAATGLTPAKTLLLLLVTTWALRLWLHLLRRSRGKPEDPRYAAFRHRFGPTRYWWVSFFQVFLLQGVLVLFISAPLQLAGAAAAPDPIGLLSVAGLLIFLIGLAFEVVADRQLQAFRDDPTRRGGVLDTGLWRFSRHPNYFGEALLWWGLWLCALGQPHGWASVVAPLAMTFLLVRVSGVTMLDAHLCASKPGYRDYVRRTSAFLPRLPKEHSRRVTAAVMATAVTAATMLILDLTWLGVIARGLYDSWLGPLKRPSVFLPAAGLFYLFYVAATVSYAVLGADSAAAAARRGAVLGLVAYGTYELTNWAVLRDWPALLVPIDLGWGVLLTAVAAWVGKRVHRKLFDTAAKTLAEPESLVV